MQTKILVYGHDPHLLMTRRRMFEHAGFRVFTTLVFANAIQLTMKQHFDVVMLCQTLSADEREEMLATAHAIQPPTKTLVLMMGDIPIPDVGTGDIVLKALERPKNLLAVIERMLASKSRVSPPRYVELPTAV